MNRTKKLFLIVPCAFMVFSCSCNQQPTGHVHVFEDTIVDATCEDRGYTSHICKDCGYEYHDSFTEPLGHDFSTFIEETGNLEADEGEIIHECVNCHQRQATSTSQINNKEKGLPAYQLGNHKVSTTGYGSSSVTVSISNFNSLDQLVIYYSFNPDYGLFYNQSFKLTLYSDKTYSIFGYNSGEYTIVASDKMHYSVDVSTDTANILFMYSDYNVSQQEAVENFATYVALYEKNGNVFEYRQLNPYVIPTFSETWLKVNGHNKFYYSTKYQNHHVDNWQRPDITQADTNWTYCCRCETPEEAIVGMLIYQENGATNVDVNLLYLKPIYRNLTDLERIFKSVKDIGTIAVYYNSDVSQEERMDMLRLAVQAGAGGVDFQGFMFHTGSTLDTHTDENVQYWKNLGYDMSFINASPKETTIDPDEDALQMQFIQEIHQMGGKVLGSQHTSAQFTRRQAVAYGEFLNHRGLDIIKIVSHTYNRAALQDTLMANVDAYNSDKITAKYSIHTNNSSISDISRVIGPLFYHTYMAFHYTNLCHLKLVMDLLHNPDIVFEDSITPDEAINRIVHKSKDPELQYLIDQYAYLTSDSFYAYGSGSNMSDRWSVNGNNTTLRMRDSEGTNSFSIRGGAFKAGWTSNNFEFETSLSGFFKPYSSSARLPKFGIFIGDQDHMLAFTYNFVASSGVGNSYSVGVKTNSYYFGYDKKTKDALDTTVVENTSVSSNVANGDSMRLKVRYVEGVISFYYSSAASGDYTLLTTLQYDDCKEFFTHDSDKNVYFGNVVEVYLGSASVGVENTVAFTNKITLL